MSTNESPILASGTASLLRAAGALMLTLLASTLMNAAVFPRFDAIFTFARDISVTCNALSLIVLGFIAYATPLPLASRPFTRITYALLAGGALLTIGGLAVENGIALTLGASLAAIGRAGAYLLVGLALSRLSAHDSALAICLGFAGKLILDGVVLLLPANAASVLFYLLPIAAVLMSSSDGRAVLDETHTCTSPKDLAITRPASFLAPASALFICLLLFQIAFGFALRFDEVAGVPRTNVLSAAPVVLVTAYLLITKRPYPADLLVRISSLFVIAGFLIASRGPLAGGIDAAPLLNAGHALFSMTAQMALVAIAARNPLGATTTLAWGQGLSSMGTLIGAAAGVGANHAAALDPALSFTVPAALLLVFAGYAIIGLAQFSFTRIIDGIEPVEEEAVTRTPEDVFEERCSAIAERFGLTPREREVFSMLARGRDRAYIEEALVVSRNTVKAHVKHVYAKLDIHSHQELIDLFEN